MLDKMNVILEVSVSVKEVRLLEIGYDRLLSISELAGEMRKRSSPFLLLKLTNSKESALFDKATMLESSSHQYTGTRTMCGQELIMAIGIRESLEQSQNLEKTRRGLISKQLPGRRL